MCNELAKYVQQICQLRRLSQKNNLQEFNQFISKKSEKDGQKALQW
jgi:hypothetical protein